MKDTLSFICAVLFSINAYALNDRYFARSPKGLLMGDAYTSIADDEYTLYYNPAILARHKGFSFWAINPSVTATNPLKEKDRFDDTGGGTTTEFSENFFNFPIHAGINGAPGFKLGGFGLTAILNHQTNITLQNKYTPMLDIDHHYDRGFIAGYAKPITKDIAIGASVKYVQRESVFGAYNLVSPRVIDAIANDELEDVLDDFGRTKGSGWGVDLGIDYVKQKNNKMFTMGFAIVDAYTLLNTDSNEEDRKVQSQPLKANFGASYSIKGKLLGFRVSSDIRNLEDTEMSLKKRFKLGTEFMLSPALSVMAGINSGQYSYGMKLNLGFLQTFAGVYGVDIGEEVDQQSSERAVIYVSLFDFNYDI
jgi:hypothetical protein